MECAPAETDFVVIGAGIAGLRAAIELMKRRTFIRRGCFVARSALAREESRGAHYRIDFPTHDDKKCLKHSIVKGDSIWFG